MPSIIERMFDPTKPTEDWGATWALGMLADSAYQHEGLQFRAAANLLGFSADGTVITPGIYLPNFCWAYAPGRLLVAIPGTKVLQQMVANIGYGGQTPIPPLTGGSVHSYFKWCADGIRDFVQDKISTIPAGTKICFVGHSLGGAVAQLLAWQTSVDAIFQVSRCVTFNSPRVGNFVWARSVADINTHLYFSAHDMVCELPPSIMITASTGQGSNPYLAGYEHRETLIKVNSVRDIKESWAAAIGGKIGAVGGKLTAWWAGNPWVRGVANLTKATGAQLYALSTLLALPAWIQDHGMAAILDGIETMPGYSPLPLPGTWKIIRDFNRAKYLLQDTSEMFRLEQVRRANFVGPANPGAGTLGALPVIPIPTRSELLEVAFEWIGEQGIVAGPPLATVEGGLLEGAFRSHATTGVSPLLGTTPVAVNVPPRPHWLFSGKDRRLLQLLADLMDAIDTRDFLAFGDNPTAAISTREPIIDWEDEDLVAAWETVRARVGQMLGYFYEPD